MKNYNLRVALTIGLVPLWLLGIFASFLILTLLLGPIVPKKPTRWVQPTNGERITEIKVSNSDRLHRCAILARTEDQQIYLYTPPRSEETLVRNVDVKTALQIEKLPTAFHFVDIDPPEIELLNSSNVSTVDVKKLIDLPDGKIVAQGHCEHAFEIWGETLDAAIVDDKGLWITWQNNYDEPFFSPELLQLAGISLSISVLMMSLVSIFLYKRIWA